MKEQLMRRPADRRYDSVARMEEKKRRRRETEEDSKNSSFCRCLFALYLFVFCGTADGGEGIGDRGRRIGEPYDRRKQGGPCHE